MSYSENLKWAEIFSCEDVWIDDKAVTNILGLCNVIQHYHVKYDSRAGNTFILYRQDGSTLEFQYIDQGLWAYDTRKQAIQMVQTVEENRFPYSNRQYQRALKARELYHSMWFPSIRDFRLALRANMIKNCPVTEQDVLLAEKIFGKDIHAIKGKTTHKKPIMITNDYIKVPQEILDAHSEVVLSGDVFYVQGIMFFIT